MDRLMLEEMIAINTREKETDREEEVEINESQRKAKTR
jgi:hypothetical protein